MESNINLQRNESPYHSRSLQALLAGACCALLVGHSALAAKTESFNTEASASTNGWTGVGNVDNGQNFGFRDSNLTGGASPAGEAGGTFIRNNVIAYYGDTNLGGILTLNDTLHAEGELGVDNNFWDGDVRIGFFNTANGGQTSMSKMLGINISEPGGGMEGYRVGAVIVPADLAPAYSAPLEMFPITGNFRFRLDYDPAGNGSLTIEIFNSDGSSRGTRTSELSAEQRAAGAEMDAFGMIVGGQDARLNTIDLYIDAVSYTSVAADQPPAIMKQPASLSVAAGADATFEVTASGAPPLAYQWRFNGVNIVGAISNSYTVVNVQTANVGLYDVSVTSSSGSAVSMPATLSLTASFTEHFNDEASATDHGWTRGGDMTEGNAFGFSNSDNTGGTPGGEAGGVFARSTAIRFYGDTTLGGTFTLNDTLHAEGEFSTEFDGWDGDFRIGFFNTASAGKTTVANVLGLNLAEPGGGFSGYRAGATLFPANGRASYSPPLELASLNDRYQFRLDYSPTGGVSGIGQLMVEFMDGAGGLIGTATYDLNSDQRVAGAVFNAFGLMVGGQGSSVPEFRLKAYVDAVSYTTIAASPVVVVPKPLLPPVAITGGWRIVFEGVPGTTYQLQRALTVNGPWVKLAGVTVGASGTGAYDDTAAPTTSAYYRTVYP